MSRKDIPYVETVQSCVYYLLSIHAIAIGSFQNAWTQENWELAWKSGSEYKLCRKNILVSQETF